ncbi:carbonic anhydrase [Pseudomonas duriflava]|uniref:Carbonic anhydrase n=1 Tax=Pseudomonas duriflava TaxID=459528 RepID=A0A562QLG2_9PSED|nr:carbonic anhydrase [Pseudomonas duriflava]TWI57564.1 carbonic anhydrase [Pseudomonas duriflava]
MRNSGLSRRVFFRSACAGALGVAGSTMLPQAFAADEPKKATITPDEALSRLKQGNQTFLENKQSLPAAMGSERRLEIARSQSPFAVLVSCSDSRVPPELLFGRGLGELFIVRNAGNTVDTVALGSIEYAVYALGVPLIVVLGHERCGAVDAALAVVEKNASYPGSLNQMIEPIIPAVLKAKAACNCAANHDELLDASVRENVQRIVGRLKTSEPVLLNPLREGKLKIVGARYDLDDGRVEFFES